MRILFDHYGNDANGAARLVKRSAYQIDESGDTTYIRYDGSDNCLIKKIVKSGSLTEITITYGGWNDRATLTNWKKPNDGVSVTINADGTYEIND